MLKIVLLAAAVAAPAPQTTRIALTVTAGGETRTYELNVADESCAEIKAKSERFADEFKICARPVASAVSLEVEAKWRSGASELEERSQAVLIRKGGKFEAGQKGHVRFAFETM